jgi:hypothetical protein
MEEFSVTSAILLSRLRLTSAGEPGETSATRFAHLQADDDAAVKAVTEAFDSTRVAQVVRHAIAGSVRPCSYLPALPELGRLADMVTTRVGAFLVADLEFGLPPLLAPVFANDTGSVVCQGTSSPSAAARSGCRLSFL